MKLKDKDEIFFIFLPFNPRGPLKRQLFLPVAVLSRQAGTLPPLLKVSSQS
ncbi:hypothetical protein M9458_033822, partial [Cirrhinus mrigala]